MSQSMRSKFLEKSLHSHSSLVQDHTIGYAKKQFFFIFLFALEMIVLEWFLVKHRSHGTSGINISYLSLT
jgi:hypothetical protein